MDKKSQHVGNHGGRYTDIDGQTKQFTYVDHDRHTTRLKHWDYSRTEKELTELEKLVELICEENVNELPQFIDEYDSILAKKYGFERLKKGKTVNGNQMNKPYEGEKWLKDLKDLYERTRIQKTTGRKNP
jgi:hypothetical protein